MERKLGLEMRGGVLGLGLIRIVSPTFLFHRNFVFHISDQSLSNL